MLNYKIAVIQMTSYYNNENKNLENIKFMIKTASENGAKLLVFPEAMNNGYIFKDKEDALNLATTLSGNFCTEIQREAKDKRVYIAIGLVEKSGKEVYNSTILIDWEGKIVARYQKNFLISGDQNYFSYGKLGFPVVSTELGKIGFFICADGRLMESTRCSAVQGADILISTANWGGEDQYRLHVPCRAYENNVWIAAATKVGKEKGIKYTGCSSIINPEGKIVAQAGTSNDEIIYAEIHIGQEKGFKHLERHPNLYKEISIPFEELPISKEIQRPVVPECGFVEVAVCQNIPQSTFKDNLIYLENQLEEIFSFRNPEIIVWPELLLEPNPYSTEANDEQSKEMKEWAKYNANKYKALMAVNLLERIDNFTYSTCYLVSPSGVAGYHRKTHLRKHEIGLLEPGDSLEVFDCGNFRVGIIIGYDAYFPETVRCLALKGADIILWPTCWHEKQEEELIALERAIENKVYILAANRVDSPAKGNSYILQPTEFRNVVDRSISSCNGGYILGCLNVYTARNKKIRGNTDIIKGRRPEFYKVLTRV